MHIITNYEFIKDDNNLKLKEVLKNNLKPKEIHIDIYADNPLISSGKPFMLLLRLIEKDITVLNDGDRLIIYKNDTYFMNILFSEITECYYEITDKYIEFILKIQNIYHRINVLTDKFI